MRTIRVISSTYGEGLNWDEEIAPGDFACGAYGGDKRTDALYRLYRFLVEDESLNVKWKDGDIIITGWSGHPVFKDCY